MDGLILLAVLVVVAFPIATIVALVRINQLSRKIGTGQAGNWAGRIAALENKIGELSRKLDGGAATRPSAPVGQTAQEPAAASAPKVAPTPTPSAPTPALTAQPRPPTLKPPAPPSGGGDGFDLETLIAGRWFNRIAVVTLLIATALFLKYAFDNDWVGETGRIAIGLLAGSLLLGWSQRLLSSGYGYFSSGITALGGGVLYLSVYAAWSYYHLVAQNVAFGGMIIITAALVAIAIGRDSQVIAVYGLLGGYLTPILLSTGVDAQVELFTYLALLNAGMLVLTHARGWVALERLAFIATLIYYFGWFEQFYNGDQLTLTLVFVTLFFAQFTALPVLHSRRGDVLRGVQVGLVLANAAWFLGTLYRMLYQSYRWELTFAVIALAAAYLAIARMVPLDENADSDGRGGRTLTRLLFAGLALTFVTLAVAIRLEGNWITIAWAVEGLILMWTGFNIRTRMLRVAGFILFGITAVRLLGHLDDYWVTNAFLLNARFAVFAVSIACFAVSYFFSQQNPDELSENESNAFKVLALGTNLFTLMILTVEVWEALGRLDPGGMFSPRMAQQLGLSVLWIGYAGILIVVGAVNKAPIVRWQGLILVGISIVKVFLVDSSFLSKGYRILSFFVLGVLLLAVSFYYQKYLREKKQGEKE